MICICLLSRLFLLECYFPLFDVVLHPLVEVLFQLLLLLPALCGQVLAMLLCNERISLVQKDHIQTAREKLHLRIWTLILDLLVDLDHEIFLIGLMQDQFFLI